MGMDYRYLLYFEHAAYVDVLERLAAMAVSGPDPPTTLELPERTLELPFSGWLGTGDRIAWDDGQQRWDFSTVLCFEPDEAIEDYTNRTGPGFDASNDEDPDRHDARSSHPIGIIDLTVQHDVGDELVLFEFGTAGSKMSMLFSESSSIRRTFTRLLEACHGRCGLFDMEDWATVFWLRGREVSEPVPTADLSLGEIERFISDPGLAPFSHGAEEIFATARHVRASAGTDQLGTHHWLLALVATENHLPAEIGPIQPIDLALELHERINRGEIGATLPEAELRRRAISHLRVWGGDLVDRASVVGIIADSLPGPPLGGSGGADQA